MNDNGYLKAIFGKVGNAKPLNRYTDRLAVGKHRLILKRYQAKPSQKGAGSILEADFMVLTSNVHAEQDVRGWAWFIDSPGWAGTYENARAQEFLGAVAKCIGDDRTVDQIGEDLAGPMQHGRGLIIDVMITPQVDRVGAEKRNAKGEVYTNSIWKPVQQTLAEIKQVRAMLDEQDGVVAEVAPPPPPVVQAPPPVQGGFGGGILSGLKGR